MAMLKLLCTYTLSKGLHANVSNVHFLMAGKKCYYRKFNIFALHLFGLNCLCSSLNDHYKAIRVVRTKYPSVPAQRALKN